MVVTVDVLLSVECMDPVEELEGLASWLRQEPELRGLVRLAATAPMPGQLGVAADALVAAVGTGGLVSVLAGSLKGYLSQPRRSDLRITVKSPDGLLVELDAKRVADVDALVRQVLGKHE